MSRLLWGSQSSCFVVCFFLTFKVSIGLHSKQITAGLEGAAADKPKQDRAAFSLPPRHQNVGTYHQVVLEGIIRLRCLQRWRAVQGVWVRPWSDEECLDRMFCLYIQAVDFCLCPEFVCQTWVIYSAEKAKQDEEEEEDDHMWSTCSIDKHKITFQKKDW